jgi:uncharacterized protein YjbI with pentapeptide repeats
MPSTDRIGSTTGPRIPDELGEATLDAGDMVDELSDVSIRGAQLLGTVVKGLLLTQSRLTKANFEESQLGRFHATDVAFEACNLSNVSLPDASFARVLLSQSKLSGLHVTKGSFVDVEFNGCRMEFASFGQAKLKNVTFTDCQLREADFSETTFDRVRFVDCDLSRATFARMRVERSDIRNCKLTELKGLAELRGVTMEWTDILAYADVFAAALGIGIATGARPSSE